MVKVSDIKDKMVENSFLSDFSAVELQSVLANATLRSFVSGDELLTEDECGTSMLLLLRGKVEVRRKEHILAVRGPGSLLGEMSLLDPAPRSASVIGIGKGTCLEFHRVELRRLLQNGDSGCIKMIQIISSTICCRLAEVNQLILEQVDDSGKGNKNVFSRLFGKMLGRK